jgi:DHA2 family methylenomycin A resistance protein-like MFS transporter
MKALHREGFLFFRATRYSHLDGEAHQPSIAVLLASSFAFIIVQLDVSIVNVALPKMGMELGADVSTLQWVVDAYTLGFAAFLLSAGVVGEKIGSKRAFLTGSHWRSLP